MLEKFLEYLSAEKRYSHHTITAYKNDLEVFFGFVLRTEGDAPPQAVTKKVVRNYIAQLSEDGIAKRSINRKLSSLRSFFLFLLKIGEINVSPTEGITSLKFNPEKQQPFSVEEMEALQEKTDLAAHQLEYLIIETLYQTGMRKSELCGMLLSQVDFGKCEILVRGKGNKMRVVPVSERLAASLEAYLAERKPHPDAAEFFFVTQKGKKLNEKFVYLTVKSYLSLVTSKQKKSPHMLRHSFATHVLGHGAEISKVKKILGHASLASTQVYTSADIEQLKKAYQRAHPRAKPERE